MMGLALMDDQLPVLKQNNAILAFAEPDARMESATTCIRCGRCVDACPMHLLPPSIARAYAVGDTDEMKRLGTMTCMECGCCSYSWPGPPAHRPGGPDGEGCGPCRVCEKHRSIIREKMR